MLSFAKDRGRIAVNVCEGDGRSYEADRAEKIWTDELLEKIFAILSPRMKAAVTMPLWTGQRKSDLLKAPLTDYDGTTVKVNQNKRDARVQIPVGKPLKEALDAILRSRDEETGTVTATTS